MCLKLSQGDKWTLQFSSYSPAFYVQNKIRPREWKRQVNEVQTQGDKPDYNKHPHTLYKNTQLRRSGWLSSYLSGT